VIARIAGRAHGVVTRQELLAADVSSREIEHRLGTGALIRVHPGVYRAGHAARSLEATYIAAVKACGDGAVLSGRAAAYLLELIKPRRAPRPEVTVASKRRVTGVRTRRARRVQATRLHGIPITNVPQTLVDLAAVLPEDELARACHEAGVRYGTKPRHVEAVLATCLNAPGAGKLRSVLLGDTRVTLSQLEKAFLELLAAHDLPLPITNRVASGRRVDCRWPEHDLTVELDSYRYHATRHAWETDRRREREAYARGDQFRRYTYGDVTETPGIVIGELTPLLGLAS